MTFYLGTDNPSWLKRTDVPLFVSRRSLAKYRTLPRARGRWALDSGGFQELNLHGRWTVTPEQYVDEVRCCVSEIGNLDWAAVQDWMCEDVVREKTGLSVREHQRRTCQSWKDLLELAPDLPWVPVVQGQRLEDYAAHVEMYWREYGLDLSQAVAIGIGSICRRQATREARAIITYLVERLAPVPVHAFGLKGKGLLALYDDRVPLGSADSMAWSFGARRRNILRPECVGGGHKRCSSCLPYALEWREQLLRKVWEVTTCR